MGIMNHIDHTFAVCAYKDSPYLEECIRSLKRQSEPSEIILCTSTPSAFIEEIAKKYDLPLFVREGQSDIQEDWNFACANAKTRLVTIAHQDDVYHRDYAKAVKDCWERYPDASVFTTDCVILRNGKTEQPGLIHCVKKLLRLPLRLRPLADRTGIKRMALMFGNPIICPSCTYNLELLQRPLFDSPYKFALDWDMMWKFAGQEGRFICEERPLIGYRIHDGATTKACIENNRRSREETEMYQKIWPGWVVCVLMFFYRGAYSAYEK